MADSSSASINNESKRKEFKMNIAKQLGINKSLPENLQMKLVVLSIKSEHEISPLIETIYGN